MKKIKSYKLFIESLEDDFHSYLQKTPSDDKYNLVHQIQKFVKFLTDKSLQLEFKYRLTDGEDGLELIEEFLDRANLPEDIDNDFRMLLLQKKIEEISNSYDKEGIKSGSDLIDLAVKSGVDMTLDYMMKEMERNEVITPERVILLINDTIKYLEEINSAYDWAYKGKRSLDGRRIKLAKEIISRLEDLGHEFL
jgi:hypothetical protein